MSPYGTRGVSSPDVLAGREVLQGHRLSLGAIGGAGEGEGGSAAPLPPQRAQQQHAYPPRDFGWESADGFPTMPVRDHASPHGRKGSSGSAELNGSKNASGALNGSTNGARGGPETIPRARDNQVTSPASAPFERDAEVHASTMRALLGTAPDLCAAVVLNLTTQTAGRGQWLHGRGARGPRQHFAARSVLHQPGYEPFERSRHSAAISPRRAYLENTILGISDPILNENCYTIALGRDRK
jgi:hypothetical protein